MRKTHTYQERGQVVSRNCIRNLDPFKTERKGIDSEISSASMKFIKLFTFQSCVCEYVRMYLVFADILFAYTVATILKISRDKILIGKRLDLFPGKK